MIVLYYIYTEYKEMRSQGLSKYWAEGWNYADWANLVLFAIVGGYKFLNQRRFTGILASENEIESQILALQIDVLSNSLIFMDQLNGINGFILWFKLLKYVAITRRLVRLRSTIVHTVWDVLSFCILFLVIAYAFVIFGHMLFKSKVSDYQTAQQVMIMPHSLPPLLSSLPPSAFLSTHPCHCPGRVRAHAHECTHTRTDGGSLLQTAITLLRGVYGDIDLTETLDSVGTWGFLFFLFWLVVSRTVLLNVIIAILMEAYAAVREKEKLSETKTVIEKIRHELKLQHAESGGQTVFSRYVVCAAELNRECAFI